MNADRIAFRPATPTDAPLLAGLARRIWPDAYRGVITDAQIDYMIGWMYADATVARELDAGVLWDILYVSGEPVGYVSYERLDADTVRLHKIYLLPQRQGLTLGRAMLDRVVQYAAGLGCRRITLTVNKQNARACAFYFKHGFATIDSIVKDIGGGFLMDDYLMEKKLTPDNLNAR